MKIYILFILGVCVLITFKCKNSKKITSDNIAYKLKVIKITEQQSVYDILAVDMKTMDTLRVISGKEWFFKKYKLKSNVNPNNSQLITEGKTYSFLLLKPSRLRVDNFTHERYYISEMDTLWREGDPDSKMPFISENTKGLRIEKQ